MMRRFFTALWATLLLKQVVGEYGIAHFSEDGEAKARDYCIYYKPAWDELPQDFHTAPRLKMFNLTRSVLCSESDVPAGGFRNHLVVVLGGNCTFYEKARLAQMNDAKGLLIIGLHWKIPPVGNKTEDEEIKIPMALISDNDMVEISKRFGEHSQVALYSSKPPLVDYSLLLVFLMAVGTVAGAGYWVGESYKCMKYHPDREEMEKKKLKLTPTLILIWVSFSCILLVLLHQFYYYLAYVIIGIFCLCSFMGLYSCLTPVVHRIPCGTVRVPENNLPFFKKRPELRMLLLAVFCASVSTTWCLFHKEEWWAWILQDILGMVFMLYALRKFLLPSFKVCVLLLTLLLVYDVFFVFITPYFTESGKSVMEEVGTGTTNSSLDEELPLVLKVPYLSFSVESVCRVYVILGFGDVMVPGLLVAYCHRFDVLVQSPRIYYGTCSAGYCVGLVLAFVSVFLTGAVQPALLYLVPCTLLPSLMVALCRSELKLFWAGGFSLPTPIAMETLPQLQSTATPTQEPGGTSGPDQQTDVPEPEGPDGKEGTILGTMPEAFQPSEEPFQEPSDGPSK